MQILEAATVDVLRKNVFFKISQTPEETPVNFVKFSRTSFLQNNSGCRAAASESEYCINEARDIDCICCRELDAMLIALTKIPECEGRTSPSRFFGHLPDY